MGLQILLRPHAETLQACPACLGILKILDSPNPPKSVPYQFQNRCSGLKPNQNLMGLQHAGTLRARPGPLGIL